MQVLIIAATYFEIAPLKSYLTKEWTMGANEIFSKDGHEITLFTTGVGMIATTFHLTRKLITQPYDLVLQAGVAGSFERSIGLAELVFVTDEQFGDIGAEDGYNFLDLFDLGLIGDDEKKYDNKRLVNPYNAELNLRKVSGLSVNTVSGSEYTASLRHKKYNAQIETMEGAALHYVCLAMGLPFLQIRGISNYVERRDKASWKMKEAIEQLNGFLTRWVERL